MFGAGGKSSLSSSKREVTIGRATVRLNQHIGNNGGQFTMKTETSAVDIDRNKGDFSYPEAHVRDAGAGLSERTVHYIADVKEDPDRKSVV